MVEDTLVICDNGLDKILGYVESHTLLTLYLQQEVVDLTDSRLLRNYKRIFIDDNRKIFPRRFKQLQYFV
jgi:CBS domain containing-hemolysin-like protein